MLRVVRNLDKIDISKNELPQNNRQYTVRTYVWINTVDLHIVRFLDANERKKGKGRELLAARQEGRSSRGGGGREKDMHQLFLTVRVIKMQKFCLLDANGVV